MAVRMRAGKLASSLRQPKNETGTTQIKLTFPSLCCSCFLPSLVKASRSGLAVIHLILFRVSHYIFDSLYLLPLTQTNESPTLPSPRVHLLLISPTKSLARRLPGKP